jgi:hypothetical protein
MRWPSKIADNDSAITPSPFVARGSAGVVRFVVRLRRARLIYCCDSVLGRASGSKAGQRFKSRGLTLPHPIPRFRSCHTVVYNPWIEVCWSSNFEDRGV